MENRVKCDRAQGCYLRECDHGKEHTEQVAGNGCSVAEDGRWYCHVATKRVSCLPEPPQAYTEARQDGGETMETRYYFKVTLVGTGEDEDEAWCDAIEGFTCNPGPTPDDTDLTFEEMKGVLCTHCEEDFQITRAEHATSFEADCPECGASMVLHEDS